VPPLLRVAANDEHQLSDATEALAQQLTLSEAEHTDLLSKPLPSLSHTSG